MTVTEADGEITAVSVAEGDADDIALSDGYTKATGTIAAVAGGDSIETAIEKIEGKVDNLNSASPFEYASGHEATKSTVLKGEGLSAQNEGEVAVGKYNTSSTGDAASAKTQFSVGIGASGSTANGFEVRANGDIYINLDLPTGTNGALANNYILLQTLLENEINWYEG